VLLKLELHLIAVKSTKTTKIVNDFIGNFTKLKHINKHQNVVVAIMDYIKSLPLPNKYSLFFPTLNAAPAEVAHTEIFLFCFVPTKIKL
jgi:hypothetical protein